MYVPTHLFDHDVFMLPNTIFFFKIRQKQIFHHYLKLKDGAQNSGFRISHILTGGYGSFGYGSTSNALKFKMSKKKIDQ